MEGADYISLSPLSPLLPMIFEYPLRRWFSSPTIQAGVVDVVECTGYMLTYMLTPPFGTISIRGTVHRPQSTTVHTRPRVLASSFPSKGARREIQISARTCFKVAGLHVSTPRDLTGHSSPHFLIGRTRFSGSRKRNRGQIHQRSDRYF